MVPETKTKKTFGPLEHHEYYVDIECQCDICVDWRTRKNFYFSDDCQNGHDLDCKCQSCKEKYRARSAYLVATHRRDLWCEGSFHASKNPKWGSLFMEWLTLQVTSQSSGYWEIRAPYRTLRHWLMDFDQDYFDSTGGVSGIVNI